MVNASFVEPISVGPEGTKATMLFSPGNSPYAEFVVGPAIAGDCEIKGLKAAGEFVVLPRAEFDALVEEAQKDALNAWVGGEAARFKFLRVVKEEEAQVEEALAPLVALLDGHTQGTGFTFWRCGDTYYIAQEDEKTQMRPGTFDGDTLTEAALAAVEAVVKEEEEHCAGCGCRAVRPNLVACVYCGKKTCRDCADEIMYDETTCNTCLAQHAREAMETHGEKKLDRVWSEQIAKLIEGVQSLLDLYPPEEDARSPMPEVGAAVAAAIQEFNRQCIVFTDMTHSIMASAKADRDRDFDAMRDDQMRTFLDLHGRLFEECYNAPTGYCAKLVHQHGCTPIAYVDKQPDRTTALRSLCKKVAALEDGGNE